MHSRYRLLLALLLVSVLALVPEVLAQTPDARSGAGIPSSDQVIFARSASIIADGSFEATDPAEGNPYWAETSTNFGTPLCTIELCGGGVARTGDWFAWFGGIAEANETGTLSQVVTIPQGSATLTFWMLMSGAGTGTFTAAIGNETVFSVSQADAASYPTYTQVNVDISAFADDEPRTLRFTGTTQAGAAGLTILVDDVSIAVATSTEESELIQPFALGSVYPNPLNGRGHVEVELAVSQHLTIEVFNILGQRVATVYDGRVPAGSHVLPVTTEDIAPGLYVVRARGEHMSAVQRVVITN